jgi:hypothetical protein
MLINVINHHQKNNQENVSDTISGNQFYFVNLFIININAKNKNKTLFIR